jgi:hypothetical protein
LASAGEAATDQAIIDLIKHSNVINPAYKVTASVSGEEALITTQRKPKATDAECKIQSVLIAKTAFEAIPESVQRVQVIFLDYDADASSSVIVRRAEIKLFGSGGLSAKDLLSSLEITKSGASSASSSATSSVLVGPAQADRLLLLGRIENLKKHGTNVSAYMTYFNQIEEAAKSGDEKSVATKITYLREHLADQEAMVKQAHSVSSGTHAITTSSRATTGAGATTGLGATPDSSLFNSMARQLGGGQIDPAVMNMAFRQVTLKNRLLDAASRHEDVSGVQQKLDEVNKLIETNRISDADKMMTQLEKQYGH